MRRLKVKRIFWAVLTLLPFPALSFAARQAVFDISDQERHYNYGALIENRLRHLKDEGHDSLGLAEAYELFKQSYPFLQDEASEEFYQYIDRLIQEGKIKLEGEIILAGNDSFTPPTRGK